MRGLPTGEPLTDHTIVPRCRGAPKVPSPKMAVFNQEPAPGGSRRSKHQRDNRLLTLGHHPPLAIPFLAPNPVFEINPRGVGLRASPCRRVDSDEPNAPGDVSQSSHDHDFVPADEIDGDEVVIVGEHDPFG